MEKPKATPAEAQRSKLKQELLYVIAQHLEDDKMSTVAEQCVSRNSFFDLQILIHCAVQI
jgi:putative lipoic acid-binding regulatory protein